MMKREEQLAKTRNAILQAARKQFLVAGYQNTSTRDIARAVGITQPALYHHFADKELIFLEVIRTVGQEVREQIGAIVDGATDSQVDGLDVLVQITQVLTTAHPRDIFTVIHSSFQFLKPENRQQLGGVFAQDYVTPIRRFFELGLIHLHSHLTPEAATQFYLTSLSPLFNSFHRVGPADVSATQQTRLLLQLILYGVAQAD